MGIELEGLVGVLLLGFWIWAILDVISTEAELCRNLPKGVWLILVLILPDIGSIVWVLLGRPERGSWRPGSTDFSAPRRPVGLEDDPRYSPTPAVTDRRSEELDRRLDEWEAAQRAKDADLDRREAELRERELALREREIERRERGTDA
ncbi:MAG: PLD nuclease N-terminal domain-containing protein [Polyangiales bacterium]